MAVSNDTSADCVSEQRSTCTCTAFRNKTLILTRDDVIISLILNYVSRINNSCRAESWTGRDYIGVGERFPPPFFFVNYTVSLRLIHESSLGVGGGEASLSRGGL